MAITRGKRPGRWLRVSLRSLAILMIGCSLLFAYWNHYLARYRQQSEAIAALRKLGMEVETRSATGPKWLRDAVGEDQFLEVVEVGVPLEPGLYDAIGFEEIQEDVQDAGDQILKHCHDLLRLEWLNLSGVKFTDGDLRHIRHLNMLETLYLGGSNISDNGLQHLQHFLNLENLSLKNTSVSDAGLAQLADLTKLKFFSLGSPNVKGPGLRFLRNCPNLTALQFVGPSATNEWVRHAGPPPTITWLEFHSTNIDAQGIAYLAKCSKLTRAYLNDNPIDDAAFQYLQKLPLTTVELSWTQVSEEALKQYRNKRRATAKTGR